MVYFMSKILHLDKFDLVLIFIMLGCIGALIYYAVFPPPPNIPPMTLNDLAIQRFINQSGLNGK